MPQPLADRIALVTGASRGIGYALAVALARAGAHVVATARTVGGLGYRNVFPPVQRVLGCGGHHHSATDVQTERAQLHFVVTEERAVGLVRHCHSSCLEIS